MNFHDVDDDDAAVHTTALQRINVLSTKPQNWFMDAPHNAEML